MKQLKELNKLYILFFFYSFPILTYVYELIHTQSNSLSIALRAITLIYAIFLVYFNFSKRRFYTSIDFWLFLGFWIAYTPRIIYDTTFNTHYLGQKPIDYILFGLMLGFFSSLPFFNKFKVDESKLEQNIYFITALLCVCGLLYALSSEKLFIDRVRGNHKLNELSFSIIAATLMIISVKRIFMKGVVFLWKPIAFLTLVLGIGCLLISGSKSPMLCFLIFLLLFIFQSLKASPIKVLIMFCLALSLIIYIIIQFDLFFMFEILTRRISHFSSDQSTLARNRSLSGAWSQFLDSPFIGSFIEEKMTRQYPHNMVLEAFMALGILGGLLFFVLYLRFAVRTFLLSWRTQFSIIPVLAMLHFVVSLSSGSLGFDYEFWASFALIASYGKQINDNNSENQILVN
ncbi:MAG: O-antigen ligase family protein [Bacteroidetes bacterium]|nr:O-antigen ligase family protein [Bacteroidota bacterium]MBS1740082.1 O-antigen ligase family protein [Bacteroidota bacterium]